MIASFEVVMRKAAANDGTVDRVVKVRFVDRAPVC